MASIYKKPNSPYWYAQYRVRTATGWKLVRLSTKILSLIHISEPTRH